MYGAPAKIELMRYRGALHMEIAAARKHKRGECSWRRVRQANRRFWRQQRRIPRQYRTRLIPSHDPRYGYTFVYGRGDTANDYPPALACRDSQAVERLRRKGLLPKVEIPV